MTAVDNKSDFDLVKDIPYLALRGEAKVVCCEDLWQNRPR